MVDHLAGVINRGRGWSSESPHGGFQDPTSQSSQALERWEAGDRRQADGGILALVKTPQGTNSDEAIAEVTKVPPREWRRPGHPRRRGSERDSGKCGRAN
jgi:hypothetical protein